MKNYGVRIRKPKPTDFICGAETGITYQEVCSDWTSYLPDLENQYGVYFDTMACFPAETEILMGDFSFKKISEIKKGDLVFTHKGNIKKVSNVFKRKHKDNLLEIKIMGLFEPIVCTKEHPILTIKGWQKADELSNKDNVLIPLLRNKKLQTKIKLSLETNKDFLWLLGFYLAEGYLGKDFPERRGQIGFSISQKEKNFADKIISIGKNLFDFEFHIYKKKGNGMEVRGSNIKLWKILNELCGKYSDKKKLSSHLMFLRPSLQVEILKGWLDGDGWFGKYERKIIGVSISKELIQQMFRILLRNKIKGVLYERKPYGIHKTAYELRICGTEINKLFDWGVKEREEKQYRKDFYYSNGCDFLHRKIKSIKKLKNREIDVFNLEVKDDNSYIVNSIAVHNCVTFSALNCIETQLNYLANAKKIPDKTLCKLIEWGYLKNGKFNFSDRYTAKLSGTTKQGNYFTNVWDSIRKDGLVPEDMWKFDKAWKWDDYYTEIPQEIKDFGKHILEIFDFKYEWVNAGICYPDLENLKVQLKQAPLQLASLTCNGWSSADVVAGCGCGTQHATEIYGIDDYIRNCDSYDRYLKKLDLKYGLPWIMKGVVTLKKPVEEIGLIPPLTHDLFYNTNDPETVFLKKKLVKLGFMSDKINFTPFYGRITQQAVLKFQRNQNLCILCLKNGKIVSGNTRLLINSLLLQ